jgi:hypothetical protein
MVARVLVVVVAIGSAMASPPAVCHEPSSCIQFLRDHTPLHQLADWLEEAVRNGPKALGESDPQSSSAARNYCANNAAFEFIPVHVGTIKLNESKSFVASGLGYDECYASMEVDFFDHAPGGMKGGDKWGYMHFKRPLPTKLVCSDWYVATTSFDRRLLNIGTVDEVWKKMHINLTYVPDEYGDIQRHGVELFIFPCGVNGTTVSVANTAALFYGDNVSTLYGCGSLT